MTEINWDEQLSALMDDELSEEEVAVTVKAIIENPALLEKWRRMQAISTVVNQVASQNPAIQNEIKTLHNKRSAQLGKRSAKGKKSVHLNQKSRITDTDPTSVA